MSSTSFDFTGQNIDMHVNHTNYLVNLSTTRQAIFEKKDTDVMSRDFKNWLRRNWISIFLLVLACMVLSFTYCQPNFIRIREIFARLTITSQS